jgi:RNA polymerase sigma-70 factor (ECF subfamily)
VTDTHRVAEFVDLYSAHARRLYVFIRGLSPQLADVDDLFQDTGRVLWEKFDEYESGTDFTAWAFQIARYRVLQHRRELFRGGVTLSDATWESLERAMAQAATEADARLDALAACLEMLQADDRELIRDRYHSSKSVKAIADSLGRSLDSVYRALQRIHTRLMDCVRRRMAERGQA